MSEPKSTAGTSPETNAAGETQIYQRAEGSDLAFSGVARLDWTDHTGPRSRLLTKSAIVGSSENADVVLEDPTISRLHVELEFRDDGIWVRDLGSTNGSFVQGIRVECARCPHLGRIRVGRTELVVAHVRERSSQRPASGETLDWHEAKFHGLVGGSRKMRAFYAMLARVAAADAPVLVRGETGSGKELAARAIHEESPRREGPFVIVDCAALPENLLDAELFGHARGAFTGASEARCGAIESANHGTVFLDEIGELPKAMQPKLLRVLEAKTIRRIGESEHRDVDVRFVFATHRDLLKMVSVGEFREDLYFRIGVLSVHLPALRERLDDLELLIDHFMPDAAPSPEIIEALEQRPWPGNVRELRNFVERLRALGADRALAMSNVNAEPSGDLASIATADGEPASPESLELDPRGSFRVFRDRWNDLGERRYMTALLTRHERNVAAASRESELDRTYLYKLIRKHAL